MADSARLSPSLPGYTVHELITEGGMGAVYRATHNVLQREVALKVIRGELAGEPEFSERFLREARAAAAVRHPNVVLIYDAGQHEGCLFLAMELISGSDLGGCVVEPPRVSELEALRIGVRCAQGLAALHDAGIVHRDVKPENILVDADGEPHIVDLGLARAQDGNDRMTQTGRVLGTVDYMSPEQAQGESNIDARSDIYSLAASLFALMVGRPPFTGATPWAIASQVITTQPPNPMQLNPQLHQQTCEVILRAMAKHPDQRYGNAAAFATALGDALRVVGTGDGDGDDRTELFEMEPATSITSRARAPFAAATGDTTMIPAAAPPRADALTMRTEVKQRGRNQRRMIGTLAIVALVVWGIIATVLLLRDRSAAPANAAEPATASPPAETGQTESTAPATSTLERRESGAKGGMVTRQADETAKPAEPAAGDTVSEIAEAGTTAAEQVAREFSTLRESIRKPLVGEVQGDIPTLVTGIVNKCTAQGWTITHEESEPGSGMVEGDLTGGEEFRVSLEQRGQFVRISIQSGAIGNAERQQRVYEAIADLF